MLCYFPVVIIDEKNYCLCGCGTEIKKGIKYTHGHWNKTVEARKHFSQKEEDFTLGLCFDGDRWRVNCRDGASELWSRVVMKNVIGRELLSKEIVHHIDENKINDDVRNLRLFESASEHSIFHLQGKKQTEETKKKRSESLKESWKDPEIRRNMVKPRIGYKSSEEKKQKMSQTMNEKWKNPGVRKNYSKSLISRKFSGSKKIRIRDNFTCQECGRIWNDIERKFPFHYIDYNNSNDFSWNRITLCWPCRTKVKKNNEDYKYWTTHFYGIIFKNCIERVSKTVDFAVFPWER